MNNSLLAALGFFFWNNGSLFWNLFCVLTLKPDTCLALKSQIAVTLFNQNTNLWLSKGGRGFQ